MARAIVDLQRDIRALSAEEKQELLRVLITELDEPSEEVTALARDFVEVVERTSRSLDATINRLDRFDEELERARNEVRQQVRHSAERWPFPLD
jgi:hypothetical protein